MNIKIKSSGVYCLIRDDYDKVYAGLKKRLGESEEQILAERKPGHEYLQWELPGDGWSALSDCDPLMSQVVKKELSRRCQAVIAEFRDNRQMAEKVLSYPDDTYVYYKADAAGRIVIKLTAWGYRYPERPGGGASGGVAAPVEKTEHVVVRLVYDGSPMPGKELRLNRFRRMTDASGVLDVGKLPVGYQFDIDADEIHKHVTVESGQGEIVIDLTAYATVEVRVRSNGAPCSGAQVDVLYGGKTLRLTCDGNGHCATNLPIDLKRGLCAVSVDGRMQQKPLDGETTVFDFNIEKREEQPEPGGPLPQTSEPAVPEEASSQRRQVEVRVRTDGMPGRGVSVRIAYAAETGTFNTDENGVARTAFAAATDEALCTVTVGTATQRRVLAEPLTAFDFDLSQSGAVPQDAVVEVHAFVGDAPYGKAAVHLQYDGREEVLYCDDNGFLSTGLTHAGREEPCSVSIDSAMQKKVLRSGVNRFDFRFEKKEDATRSAHGSWLSWLLCGLLFSVIALLVAATYRFGAGVLFGSL